MVILGTNLGKFGSAFILDLVIFLHKLFIIYLYFGPLSLIWIFIYLFGLFYNPFVALLGRLHGVD